MSQPILFTLKDPYQANGFAPIPSNVRPSVAQIAPSQLFSGGLGGAWWDFSDTSTLFQSGTRSSPGTAVAVDGDPVGLVLDKSGNAYDLVQATSTKRPLFRTSGGVSWLEFDGIDDFLSVANFNLSAYSQLGYCVGVTPTTTSTAIVAELGIDTNGSTAGTFYLAAANDNVAGQYSFAINGTGASGIDAVKTTATNIGSGVTNVISSASFDLGNASALARLPIRLNGANTPTTVAADGGGVGTVFASTQTLYVGARAGTSLFFKGKLYGLLIRGGTLQSGEITSLDSWMLAKTVASGGGTTYNDTLSEGATAADGLANAATWTSSLTEPVTAADSSASAATMPNTLAETVTGADSASGGLLILGSVSEGLTAADAETAAATWGPALSEALTAADALSSTATFAGALSEALTASDAETGAETLLPTLSETITANDNASSRATFPNALAEALAAADGYTLGNAPYNDTISESLAAGVSLNSAMALTNALSEAATAADAVASALTAIAAVAEQLTAAGTASSTASVGAALAETVAANDNAASVVSYASNIAEIVSASDTAVATLSPHHPDVTTPTGRRASGEMEARSAAGATQPRSASGVEPGRTASGAATDRRAAGNLQPRRATG